MDEHSFRGPSCWRDSARAQGLQKQTCRWYSDHFICSMSAISLLFFFVIERSVMALVLYNKCMLEKVTTQRTQQFSDFSKSKEPQSRSQSFVPLDQRSENVSSGRKHYERTKEITEFWLSGSLRICIYGACLKWLLPELSFSDRWSRGTKLWERDWKNPGKYKACAVARKIETDCFDTNLLISNDPVVRISRNLAK